MVQKVLSALLALALAVLLVAPTYILLQRNRAEKAKTAHALELLRDLVHEELVRNLAVHDANAKSRDMHLLEQIDKLLARPTTHITRVGRTVYITRTICKTPSGKPC